ncbi:alpha-L-fucosidase [Paraflavitalea sp. CAU 1676]|uniref:alpha-L-fucosidase n=1 Tax=Paraflavitalea sp. CAU 1676 TaxID=3032598 RepID=UPI0023DB447B|nr:alpha-L-fucosidase [Paraflavitalea sp. CAU 1676]MDF2193310.1 alpha-L-fucosidase [Paraflavitalea sp. CAU 1676]
MTLTYKHIWNTLLLSSVVGLSAQAQTAGDEDKEMFNRAKARDQEAIDAAVKEWWTSSMKTHDQRIQWWREARFGMFIHWGVYSLPGGEWKGKKVGGYAEHLMRKEKISRAEYLGLAHQFNPVNFNAEQWILQAKAAGMKYFIITAKHHDGFAMYNSGVSDFDIIDQTPFKRDPMAELAAACKKHGMRFGFYYSHAFDWEHPDAPGNDWEFNNPGGDKLLHGGARWYDEHPELLPKAQKYVAEKAIPQIKELINKYHPDILWFDTPHKLPLSENIHILQAIRETDPNVVVNGRLARSADISFGDYKNTADRPAEFYPVEGDWEAIPTTNESYGYSKYDSSHKSVAFFIQLMAKSASRGGNLLMNIGPKGDGTFDARDVAILQGIGDWVKKNYESVGGAGASGMPLQNWGVTTRKDKKLYLHVFQWPQNGRLQVGSMPAMAKKVYLLADGAKLPLKFVQTATSDGLTGITVSLPAKPNDTTNTVLVVELGNEHKIGKGVFVHSNIPLTRLLAFDAVQTGKGFQFGDGKTDKYYVAGWKLASQWLHWDLRFDTPAKYKMIIKYLAGPDAGGTYRVELDGKGQEYSVLKAKKDTEVQVQDLGEVTVSPGSRQLIVKPVAVVGQELMKILEIQLIKIP